LVFSILGLMPVVLIHGLTLWFT